MTSDVYLFEIHQLEGIDISGRMFSRDVGIDVSEEGYTGRFAYEGLSLLSGAHPTVQEAIAEIARKLQRKNFSSLRTRVNFREERYLAEREPWIDHVNP